MRATVLSTLIGLSSLALAQDLASLPVCAQTAALGATASTGCAPADVACLCTNFGSLQGAIQAGCTSVSDQQAACAWGNSACASYGVNIPCDTGAGAAPAETPTDTGSAPPADADTTDAAAPPADTGAAVVDPAAGGSSTPLVPEEGVTPTGTDMAATAGTDMMTGTDSMTSSMTSMPTSMMSSSMMNGTMTSHMSGSGSNMTHSATMSGSMSASATGSGPTSMYTGAASAAAGRGGVFVGVMGVAAVFAFF